MVHLLSNTVMSESTEPIFTKILMSKKAEHNMKSGHFVHTEMWTVTKMDLTLFRQLADK